MEKIKEIDFRSFLIGFMLAVLLLLTLGGTGGVQDIRIVGIDTYDAMRLKLEDQPLRVRVGD